MPWYASVVFMLLSLTLCPCFQTLLTSPAPCISRSSPDFPLSIHPPDALRISHRSQSPDCHIHLLTCSLFPNHHPQYLLAHFHLLLARLSTLILCVLPMLGLMPNKGANYTRDARWRDCCWIHVCETQCFFSSEEQKNVKYTGGQSNFPIIVYIFTHHVFQIRSYSVLYPRWLSCQQGHYHIHLEYWRLKNIFWCVPNSLLTANKKLWLQKWNEFCHFRTMTTFFGHRKQKYWF